MRHVETDPSGRYIRYDVVLGRGSYKNVYKAFDTHEAMEVAWNQLQVDRIPQSQLSKVRFEVELLQRLDHKNIINLFAAWRGKNPNGKPTMDFITELMSSGTLKEYLTRARAMKLKVIRRWCHNLLEAIAYLHSQTPPVMHRDLKCDNIFINGHVGEVKIGDLGLSGVKQDAVAQSVIGTPEFMAPELYEEAYTEKVDIYAFGMCMLEMITMEYPYSECNNPAQIFRKVFSGEKPLSFQRLPNSDIKQVIGACLERERKRPSAAELLRHPLFADWASDDGKMTNISLNSHRSSPRSLMRTDCMGVRKGQSAVYKRGQSNAAIRVQSQGQSMGMSLTNPAAAKMIFKDLKVGQSLCFNSMGLSRDVLLAKENLHRLISDTEVSVTSANDGGELRIALRIPVDGETKKVEFFFDPYADDVREISRELVQEFDLHEEEANRIRKDIETQIKRYQSKTFKQGGIDEDVRLEILSNELCLEDERSVSESIGARHSRMSYRYSPSQSGSSNHSQDVQRETLITSIASTDSVDRSEKHIEVHGNQRSGRTTAGSQQSSLIRSIADAKRLSGVSHPRSSAGDSVQEAIYLSEDNVAHTTCTGSSFSSCAGFDKNEFKANMALLEHCSKGKYEAVQQKLKSGAFASFADYDRRTPLHLAATEGHADVVKLLISYEADIHAEDRWGSTPVEDARSHGHEKVVKILVDAGAYVDTRTLSKKEINSMQLMQYAANGFYDMVREKLMAGAVANFADYDKRTPLHLSCAEGHLDVTHLLLLNGGDPMFKDRFGNTPIDEALKNDHEELMPILKQYGGCMPAHLLSEEEREYQYGMDLVNHASRGRVEKVKFLIEQGANVCFGDYDRRTALHLACAEGHSAVAIALVKAGADPDFEDRWGVSSFDEAEKSAHEELVMVMRKFQKSGLASTPMQSPRCVERKSLV